LFIFTLVSADQLWLVDERFMWFPIYGRNEGTFMADECLGKACAVCGKRINGPGFRCPSCRLCLCFFCGMKIVLAESSMNPLCPSCGNKLD
jgi:DNA-directed RNA polymerase subunit RPC12/RpoP